MSWTPGYTEAEIREAVSSSPSYSAALRLLGLRPAGGNFKTLKKLIAHYGISTGHFDPNWVLRGQRTRRKTPLSEVLVERSNYSRWRLKNRLYDAGLKKRECEMCGQGELWHGRPLVLTLDHINGVADDNRLGNLRIVCPNCAATLETHCGRQNAIDITPRTCLHCGGEFRPKYPQQRYCSHMCGVHSRGNRDPRPELRKVERPSYEQLIDEIRASNFSAVARRYGVSDNAIRKWVRWYEARMPEPGGA